MIQLVGIVISSHLLREFSVTNLYYVGQSLQESYFSHSLQFKLGVFATHEVELSRK